MSQYLEKTIKNLSADEKMKLIVIYKEIIILLI